MVVLHVLFYILQCFDKYQLEKCDTNILVLAVIFCNQMQL